MSDKKLPNERFVIRTDIDPTDEAAVDSLAAEITDWVAVKREVVMLESIRGRLASIFARIR